MKPKTCKRVGALLLTASMMGTQALAVDGTPVDPKAPYGPPISGVFHNQQVEGYDGNYTVFIPDNYEFCSPAVMLLTPEDQTAETFFTSETGKAWQKLCNEKGIAAVIIEAQDGEWNLGDSTSGRDDEAYLKKVFDTTRSKSTDIAAAFDMNERAFYMIGYEEGGVAAQEFAMEWPAIMCGVATVGGSAVPKDVMTEVGDSLSYPFAQADSLKGREENAIPNKDIAVPMWIVESKDSNMNSDEVVKYWVNANDAVSTTASGLTKEAYANKDNDRQRVWVTDSSKADAATPETLYNELSEVQRFVGDPGGRLEWAVAHENNGKTGFFTHEETVDGSIRRWMTYVPSTYRSGQDVPLVVAMHGYSSAMTAFTGDSRWQDVAEKHGFIVVFPQAYPNYYPGRGNISVPVWHNYAYTLDNTATDDVNFIRYIVAETEEEYNIDESRVYATGHSNGSSMTWALANNCQDLFAACAPVGWQLGSTDESAPSAYTTMPIWTCMGEYDLGDATVFEDGNNNDKTIKGWIARNQLSSTEKISNAADGRFVIHSYSNKDDIPLFHFAEIKNSPHAYMPSQAEYIYEEFFSKFSREDGVLYYNNTAVENPYQAFTDVTPGDWSYEAVQYMHENDLMAGIGNDKFAPKLVLNRAMVAQILYNAAGKPSVTENAVFADVSKNAWYYDAVQWASKNGVTAGIGGNKFDPDANVTREQFAQFLYNYEGKPTVSGSLSKYADDSKVSTWAKNALLWANQNGIVNGKPSGNTVYLDPQGNATRAETASMLMKYCEMKK